MVSPTVDAEGEILGEAFDEYRTLLSDASKSLDGLIGRAEAMVEDPETMDERSPWRKWANTRRLFKEAYDAAVQRSSAHRQKLEQLKAIDEQQQAHVRETGRVQEELRLVANAEETHEAERQAWESLMAERNDALDEQCAKLTKDSGGAIAARVKRYADTRDFVESLKQAVAGSRVPGNRIEGLGAEISGAETPEAANALWRGVLADLEKLAEFDEERDGVEKRPDAPALSGVGLSAANLDGISRSLKSDDWLTLSLHANQQRTGF